MKQITYNYRIINLIITSFLVLIFVLIIVVDYPRSLAILENEEFRIWYLDPAVGFNSGQEKGPGMVTSLIFNIIAGLLFIYVAIQLNIIRKKKDYHYLANNIYYSALLIGIGRFIEGFYIITETDLRGLLFGVGRIFIPLDNFAIILFFIVCCDIFFSVQIEKGSKLSKYIFYLGWIAFLFSWLAILVYFVDNSILETLAHGINIAIIAIIIMFSIALEFQILQLANRVEEKKQEVRYIGIILILYILVAILTLILIIIFPDLFQYILRTIKNIMLTVIAILYYAAFIRPVK